jgi:hypothetical protein
MRHEYETTEQTARALLDCVKAVSSEWGVSKTYIYGILGGEKTDPYAPFRAMYRALLRTPNGNEQAGIYLDDLLTLQMMESERRSGLGRELSETELTAQVNGESTDVVAALLTGKTAREKRRECRELIAASLRLLAKLEETE